MQAREPEDQETILRSAMEFLETTDGGTVFRAIALARELHLIDFDDWELEKVQYRDETEVSLVHAYRRRRAPRCPHGSRA